MLIQRLEHVDPISLYAVVREEGRDPFMLESRTKEGSRARYTYISSDPAYNVEIGDGGTYVDGSYLSSERNPFKALKSLHEGHVDGDGFVGGFVGYAAYDSVHADIGGHIAEPSCFGFYPGVFVYDHAHDTLTYRCLPGHEGHDVGSIVAEARRTEVGTCKAPSSIRRCDADRACYEDLVERAKDYVFSGDVFQVVLSREYEVSTPMSPFEAYLRLRGANPSPYLFLIEFERMKVAGSSPETMVRVEGDTLHINPIAGTTVRGASHSEDGALATRLLHDEKERAEHVMLVDLARNDARKVALPGSVRVPTYMEVVAYARVQHIESEVVAKLRPHATMYDALEAAFPAGTLSGAPKASAMEVISELERSPRRVYGGCAGYFSLNGTADTAISIRMISFDDACRVRAGAGIVADSVPSSEFDETEKKMSAVLSALNVERGI